MRNILTKFKVVDWLLLMFLIALVGSCCLIVLLQLIKLPGTDSSDKLEAAVLY